MSRGKSISRREFLKNAARIGAFGAIGLVSLRLFRGGGKLRERCTNDWICSRCLRVSGCGLPQALSYRKAAAGPSKGESR